MKEAEDEFLKVVAKRAKEKGLKMTGRHADGRGYSLIDFDENDQPVYLQEENVNAAITTAANEVRSNPTYNGVTGSSITIGLWEASGIPRLTHREFGDRITVEDGTSTLSGHASHVAGTLIAEGRNSSIMGMAPEAKILAFTTGNEVSEMTANGAAEPGSTQLYLSNHSYGVGQGWEFADGEWTYRGTFSDDNNPANDFERDFGRYSGGSQNWDRITHNLPYYLVFVSAGNQRNDNPDDGDRWTRNGNNFSYDASEHPGGDGDYKDGWDNMEGRKLAKNVITVGNAADAVRNGERDVSRAVTVASSSRGPVDDGRIKPDITANGSSVLSVGDDNDSDTATLTGTSMSTPNVCGSTALLVDYYSSLFPGEAMRSSTLKALILHTADDDGNPGPDYRYGWGIMNTKTAADVIAVHAENEGGATIIEDTVDNQLTSREYTFLWDGTGPLRVTLCWTDPEGSTKSDHDDREKALVNDLNLTITGPDGTHFPYVMPHVGDWSVGSIDDNAVTGVNDVDNVEQVFLASPTEGEYTVTVNYAGSLDEDTQDFGLIVTGQADLTTLQIWRRDNFGVTIGSGNTVDDADFDNDGLSNLLEYGLGTSPTEPNASPTIISESKIGGTLLVDISANNNDSVNSTAAAFKAFDLAVDLDSDVNNIASDGAVTGTAGIAGDVDIRGSIFATSNTSLIRNDVPIFDGYIFARDAVDPSVAVTGLTGLSAGDKVTLTVFSIGDNDEQVAPVVLNVDGQTLTSPVTSVDLPAATFSFTAASDITEFDFFADNSEGGNAFAGINGFSITKEISTAPSNFVVRYPRSVEAMADFDFEVVWSNDLTSEIWNTTNITEVILSDDGVTQQVAATDTSPTKSEKRFYRVRMTQK